MANIYAERQAARAATGAQPATAAPADPSAAFREQAQTTAGNVYRQRREERGEFAVPAAPKEDPLGQFGAGLVKGIPNAVTGTADLVEKGVIDNALMNNPATGRNQALTTIEAWGDLFSGKDPAAEAAKRAESSKPYEPVSGKTIRAGLDATNLNPDHYFRPPATPGERIAEMAGEGLVTSIFSPNKAQGWAKLAQVATDALIGGAAGAGSQAAMEAAPEWADPLVGLAGGLGAGIGAAGALGAAKGVGRGFKRAGAYVAPAVAGRRGLERMAGAQLAETVGDRQAAIDALGSADELVPGSKPTAFQATGDVGLGSLERALARGDDEFKKKLLDRITQQNEARVAALDTIQESGNPALVADFFRGRMRELEDTADELYKVAEGRAKGAYEGLGERPAGEIGEQARGAMDATFKRLNAEANRLWEGIDPDGTMTVRTEPLIQRTAAIYGRMSPEEALSLSAAEKNLAGIIGGYEGELPFARFKDLRKEISRAMREANSFASPNTSAYHRLKQLRSAVEESVSDSIAGKMQADPSLADDFVTKARDWYERGVTRETGAGTPPGAVRAAAGAARAIPEEGGAGVSPGREPGAPAGDTGLSPDDTAARRAVEGGLDQSAPPVDTPAFKRWFGDSKVVDESGKPLVVYHGSRVPFLDRFDLGAEGTGAVNGLGKKLGGVWFTSSEDNAHFFADPRESTKASADDIMTYGEGDRNYASVSDVDGESLFEVGPYRTEDEAKRAAVDAVDRYNDDPNRGSGVSAQYLSLKNPLMLNGKIPREAEFARAKAQGHDGIIARNVADGSHYGDVYVAFDPTQIKSTANRGTFDPNSPNILDQSGTVGDPGTKRPFYSAALKSVEESKNNRASPQQWAATIKNTPGVKQEELDWLGLTPWLAAQKGPVTKEQIADFIRANQIEVEEVNLAGDAADEFAADVPRRFDWEPDEIDEDFVREIAGERAAEESDDYRERIANSEGIEPEEVTEAQIEQAAFEDEMRWRSQEPDGWHASVAVETPDGSQTIYDIRRDSDGYTQIYNNDMGDVGAGQMDEDDIRSAIATHLEESFEKPAGEAGADGPTQYEDYTLPGGKDYHELLMKLPERRGFESSVPSKVVEDKYKAEWAALSREVDDAYLQYRQASGKPGFEGAATQYQAASDKLDALHKKMVEETRSTSAPWRKGENFKAPHYDDQKTNILAHIRFKDRTSVDGKKTLFLEEVQSDWHQQGRDKGYIGAEKPADTTGFSATETEQYGEPYWKVVDKDGNHFYSVPRRPGETPAQAIERAAADKAKAEVSGGVPDAPFKTTWPELALKRMIRWAADNGYDQIAWTPGSVQNARYGLSQHVDMIDWRPLATDTTHRLVEVHTQRRGTMRLMVDADGTVINSPSGFGGDTAGKPLSEVIGKDLASQIMAEADGRISKEGLAEIGGSGMREFYDRVMVSLGNKLGKKFDAQVGKTQIRVRGQQGDEYLDTVALPITDKMRAGAQEGFPLFQKANEAATSPHNDLPEPTAAQKEAGNYKKGHIKLGGLDLAIENPAGSKRSGTDSAGKRWSVDMKDHYGYIKGTTGRDKDHLDVFVARNAGDLNNDSPAFVVNQIDPKTGKFDEHKIMLGYPNRAAAEAAYKANYAKDWKGMGSLIPTTLGDMKRWIADGNTKRPFEQRSIPDAQGSIGAGGVRSVPGEAAPAAGNAGREADGSLRGLPRKVGDFRASAYPGAQKVAANYMKSAGLEYAPPNTYAKVVPERATRIADAYEAMEHKPQDPEVKAAYKAMADETLAQYQAMLDDGVEIEFIAPGQADPYAGNPRNMTEDVRNNKHMWVFATRDGFGSDATFDVSDNPLLGESGFEISGQPATINDIFRAVHDYFGHVKEGVGFRADGEENAWRAHSAMYSPQARRAMTSETRGQNSWVNYGPHGEKNRTAKSEETHYADQKIGLLPEWVALEGAGDDVARASIADTMAERFAAAGRPKKEAAAAGQIVDAFYTTMAKRLGKTVEEVQEQFPLPQVQQKADTGALSQGRRGSIMDPGSKKSLISMFEKADASTAVHESGHQFMEMFRRVANEKGAPEAITKDWRAVNAWWEKNANDVAKDGSGDARDRAGTITNKDVRAVIHQGTTGNAAKDQAVYRGMQEQWARAFESYLKDGKAPNAALKNVFEQFKDWLGQVYRNLTGLNVKMSPEIRQVFDQMLGGEAGPSGKLMDKAAADRFATATAATRNLKDTFGAKPVKQIMRRPGPTYPFDMTDEAVSSQLWKAGPEGAANIQNVTRAGAPKEAIEAAAILSAKRAASKDGVLDPAKFEAWRSKHADALREVPELDRRLADASTAARTMAAVGERNAAAIDSVRKTAVGKLLHVEHDADVSAAVGSLLNRPGAVKAMRELASEAAGDPDALEGLRRAVVDHMLTRLKTSKDALRNDTFQRFLGRNAPALQQVLTPEQMNGLRAIALDLKRASKDTRAPGGGSDTAENLAARQKYIHEKPSILGSIIRQALGSSLTGIAAHTFFGPLAGFASWIGQTLGGTVLQHLRAAGIKRVDDLIKEAVLDPELMKVLLMKAPKEKNRGSALTLSNKLANLAAMNLVLSISQGQEKEPRVVRRRADDSAVAPMLGVRG